MKKFYVLILMAFISIDLSAQFNIDAGSTNYTQNFDGLGTIAGTWTDNSTVTGWYARTDVTSPITAYGVNTGTSTAGGLYSYGVANTNPLTDRALGYATSNAFTGTAGAGKNYIGWRLKNNTGVTITQIDVTWTGEQWRKENNAAAHSFNLTYQTGVTVTALTAGVWTSASSSFTSPIVGATTAAALDGNNPANRSAGITATITVSIAPGDEIMLRWEDLNDSGNDHHLTIDDVTVNATTPPVGTPDIALSSTNPAIAAGNILQGSTNSLIYQFELAVTSAPANLNGVTINTAGTYAATDVSNFKVWYSADNTFDPVTDEMLAIKSTSLDAGSHIFSPFTSQVIADGATGYIFITADVPCTATLGNSISVNAITTGDISFIAGNESGTAFNGDAQTITSGTPIDATGAAASTGNNESIVSWTNPLGCYNEIMIVASSGSSNSGIPSGDGTAYTADLVFGNGTALGNGFVVYKGGTSPQTVTGLTNGVQYYFKIFTRLGTLWSNGVEVNATPANVTNATDYFRTRATGDWNSITTWESSPDNNTWIAATMVPTTAANTITIRNDDTVTVSIATSVDQVIIQSGGVLINTAALTIADDAGTANDLLIESGGIWTLSVGGAPGGAGTIRNQTGGIIRVSATGTIQLLQAARFTYENASILEYTLTSSFSASGVTYFPNADAVTIPIFRTTSNIASAVGGGSNTVINGLFEANGTVTFSGTGTKTFRNGISGTGNVSQGTAGMFIISGTAQLGGSGSLTLGTAGLQISSTSTTTLINSKVIDGGIITVDGILDAGTYQLSGTAGITINGTLRTANADGISPAGTLALSGTKLLGPASTIVYNSSIPQLLTSGFPYVNVTIENGGTKTLDGAVNITGTLTLTNGIVVSTAVNLLTIGATGTIIGASGVSFIDGPLQRYTDMAVPYLFPVGKGILYKPFEIIPASATGSSFIGEYFTPNINTTSPVCNPVKLEAYVVNERWNVIRSSGTDNAAIRLNYVQTVSAGNWTNGTAPMPNPDNTKGITVANYLMGSGCWEVYPDISSLVVGDAASGQPATSALSSFGDFTFGYAAFDALPVKIDFIEGIKQGSAHKITWKVTCTNTPTADMSLERSADGRIFGSIYNLIATAERCLQSFTFSDENPVSGVNYYRLRMTDADGRSSFSATIALLNKDKGFDIVSISPNPVVNSASLSISSAVNAKMQLVISDMTGAIVSRQNIKLVAGSNITNINLERLPAGAYQIIGSLPGEEIRTLRFIKR